LAEKTSWSHDYILWELPFTEGMRLLDYWFWKNPDHGKVLRWADDVWDPDEALTSPGECGDEYQS
jgi:hypothetical protein